MKLKRILAFTLLIALLLAAFPMAADLTPRDKSKHLEILTVGNSMTYYNDLGKPGGMLDNLAKAAGYDVTITALYKGGYELSQFLDEKDAYGRTAKPAIENGKFDIILIQDNGKIECKKAAVLKVNCKNFKKIADKMGAELFLYQTYGPADDYSAISGYGKNCLDAEMNSRSIVEKVCSEVEGLTPAYAGAAFTKVHTEHPEMELHFTDRLHPSELGSFVMACEIFGTIFGVDPTTVSYNGPATADQAKILKEAAAYVLKNGPQVDPAYSKIKSGTTTTTTTDPEPTPVEEKLPFTDVKESDWFYTYVQKLYEENVISGMTATTFVPNGTLTWGQSLKLVCCALANGEQGTVSGHWASGYLATAKAKGWITEDVNLDQPITRVELCRVGAKAKGVTEQPASNPFTDCKDEAVLALVNAGVINGMTATTFQPDSLLTRAQISKIIYLLKVL